MLTLQHYLILSGLLFTIGMVGIVLHRNALVTLMAIEINLNAANLVTIAFAQFRDQLDGQIFYFFVIAIAAAEVAVGLAILTALFKHKKTLDVTVIQ